ncbi:MAG: Verrucomicrobia phage [Actinomycetota bacterium]|jgi:hypothetical protein
MPQLNYGLIGPAIDAKAVTPSDTADLPDGPCKALWVGGAGAISLITGGGSTVLVSGITAGYKLDMTAVRVRATGTTATLILALY